MLTPRSIIGSHLESYEDKYEYLAFLRFLVLIEVVEDYVYYIHLFAFSKSMSSLVLRFMYFLLSQSE